MDTKVISQPKTLYDALDKSNAGIAEFLLPLVFAGHVNQITWPKPSWATQMPTGAFKQLAIGKRKSNAALGVTTELSYFVASELFCPVGEMEASTVRYWDLFATETSLSAASADAIGNARQKSKCYVLDIDLDYFSTWDPFRKDLEARIGESAVKTVAQLFECVHYRRPPLESSTAVQRSLERKRFCKLIDRVQAVDTYGSKQEWAQLVGKLTLACTDGVNVDKAFADFTQLLKQYYHGKATRSRILAAGSHLGLPHHESSSEEIERMVTELEQFLHSHALDAANPPAIVTIAKSTGDEYLPPHQLDEVLPRVLQMLERVFGQLWTKVVEHEPVQGSKKAPPS